ncbi:queuine tRNA-ribosyltransferase [Gregarina niphandrodes]|uniref:Queuine tRNA-ribosyltransferase catalytic subunit 1 n=1 Tax=Gregarina niphandrodes TaxID=110365 RepID=A0A023BD93_GRENI|nr:queuine tRNA-ribosyltransferase [Gregarina niphandrodes]EZG87281.1 queuine tRNA-ribosyltransferase [Gregarina niphandrodes]|eukprot:XP_011128677.1 queuine tRNA-ribosyltransferase [Gregarina niphandrodes]
MPGPYKRSLEDAGCPQKGCPLDASEERTITEESVTGAAPTGVAPVGIERAKRRRSDFPPNVPEECEKTAVSPMTVTPATVTPASVVTSDTITPATIVPRDVVPVCSVYKGRASSFTLRMVDGRARRGTLELPHARVETPCFMPVGTNGPMKMILSERMERLGPSLMLNNTYHLGARLGRELLTHFGGTHTMMQWDGGLLTDSGGFQMVSLLKLARITEEGVEFEHPSTREKMLLTPEESIAIQNAIGADVMMALDDVISAVDDDRKRFEISVGRTTRWLHRCMAANARPDEQNLWGIVQGGLYADLREESLKQLRDLDLPGFAIGGLSGGESKAQFAEMVELCTRRYGQGLPEHKSRYLMGVGYPLDIVVCVALGCDLFDCVFPTRTARFGVALADEGHIRLKNNAYRTDPRPVDETCDCYMCQHFTRAFIHATIASSPSTLSMISEHNIRYLHNLGVRMRTAIEQKNYSGFVRDFLAKQFPPAEDRFPPIWVRGALRQVMPEVESWYSWDSLTPAQIEAMQKDEKCGSHSHTEFQPRCTAAVEGDAGNQS